MIRANAGRFPVRVTTSIQLESVTIRPYLTRSAPVDLSWFDCLAPTLRLEEMEIAPSAKHALSTNLLIRSYKIVTVLVPL
jgi:hypothetical protein